jgi:hypothetical protein
MWLCFLFVREFDSLCQEAKSFCHTESVHFPHVLTEGSDGRSPIIVKLAPQSPCCRKQARSLLTPPQKMHTKILWNLFKKMSLLPESVFETFSYTTLLLPAGFLNLAVIWHLIRDPCCVGWSVARFLWGFNFIRAEKILGQCNLKVEPCCYCTVQRAQADCGMHTETAQATENMFIQTNA